FVADLEVGPDDTVLGIGVTSDQTYDHSNYLEAWHPHRARITAVGIDDARFLEAKYPGVRFVQADGRDLPFDAGSFDYVHSSAVLEHVGSGDRQMKFISEALRVARKGVFLTTPNRWFPVEFHTVLPFVHWLPKKNFPPLMRMTGYGFLAEESNLNLLSRREIRAISACVAGFEFPVSSVSLWGWPSNLLLIGRRQK